MKINLFKVLLYDFLIVISVNAFLYFLLVLVFNDDLSVLRHGDEFALMTLAELSGIVFFAILFIISYLLPLFYIQKRHIETKSATELFWRFMPLVALIATVFAGFVMMIGGLFDNKGLVGEAWVNIWLIYGISYTGLVAFVYLVKPKNQIKE
ncbi:MAG: hypothetical protein WCL06_11270 [Bacteroidota bacterium]